ncbi:CHAT domain-containing protein [Actinomadura welshii]|uniref:CHAT domain-containing protein n=1 Tax=Actinomadura welshii TaxID=3103817 RepID=UPI0003AD656C|nr:CHAT domain-containing protein [Actinomadura madurae]
MAREHAADGVLLPSPEPLTLTVSLDDGQKHWQARLTDVSGRVLSEHRGEPDTTAEQYEALSDLPGYIRDHSAPDVRSAREREISLSAGTWLATRMLGGTARTMAARAPCTVLVEATGDHAARWPWELAVVDGRTLAEHGAVFVTAADTTRRRETPSAERPLRMLAVFSMPDGTAALDLRRERQELTALTRRLAERHSRSVHLRILQYGVTREALATAMADEEGWDVVHLAGHGRRSTFTLETADGERDRVDVLDMLSLLTGPPRAGATRRARLVTVSACESFGLAPELTRNLHTAVLAMRFPVADDLAISLLADLYEYLLGTGLALPAALASARRRAEGRSPLAWAAPTLFGPSAATLRLPAPSSGAAPSPPALGVLPDPPQRFVGRVRTMARCRRALASGGATALILHGLPGMGKTSLALELADLERTDFGDVLWCEVPDDEIGRDHALTDLTEMLRSGLPDVDLTGVLEASDGRSDRLPALTSAMAAARVLVVVDGVEALLTGSGHWRDSRWAALLTALADHEGRGRVVMTSRTLPESPPPGTTVEFLGPLSEQEAVLLARELPLLGALLDGEHPGVPPDQARDLGRRTLALADGHPKLLELADGQAADPERLTRLLGPPRPRRDAAGEADLLTDWTTTAVRGLDAPARMLFSVLCHLHPGDRVPAVASTIWRAVTRQTADFDACLARLVATALTAFDEATGALRLHPLVASTGGSLTDEPARAAIVEAAATYWVAEIEAAVDAERAGGPASDVNRAALAGAPYLLEGGKVKTASDALDLVLRRERSRHGLSALVPLLARLIQMAAGTEEELPAKRLLANVLLLLGDSSAEAITQGLRKEALARGDLDMAAVLISDLIIAARNAGRLVQALDLAEEQIALGERAGAGPWTRLLHDDQRLELLIATGQAARITDELAAHRDRLDDLVERDEPAGDNESVRPFWVRELVLGTCRSAASATRDWAASARLAQEIMELKVRRGAGPREVSRARFNICGPLEKLGRLDEARRHLSTCRTVFEQENDLDGIAASLSALARIEDARGHPGAAVRAARDAVRYAYKHGDLALIVSTHTNLGYRLAAQARTDEQMADAAAHHLAAALLGTLAGHTRGDEALDALADDLLTQVTEDGRLNEAGKSWPGTTEDLTLAIGTDLHVPLATLGASYDDATLQDLFRRATRLAEERLHIELATWDPVLAALAMGEATAALQTMAASPGRARLAEALEALPSRPGGEPPEDLDEISTAVFRRAAAVVAGRVRLAPDLHLAVPLVDLLGECVAATYDDDDRPNIVLANLEGLREDPEFVPLADALEAIIDGARDADRLTQGLHPDDAAAIRAVLPHVGPPEE